MSYLPIRGSFPKTNSERFSILGQQSTPVTSGILGISQSAGQNRSAKSWESGIRVSGGQAAFITILYTSIIHRMSIYYIYKCVYINPLTYIYINPLIYIYMLIHYHIYIVYSVYIYTYIYICTSLYIFIYTPLIIWMCMYHMRRCSFRCIIPFLGLVFVNIGHHQHHQPDMDH